MTESNYVEIEGESTDAKIMGLSEETVEPNVVDQIQTMVDHEAFTGDVRVMPDTHVGSGATIGFTMPVQNDPVRICPNVIGVDIGCGMIAVKLNEELSTDSDRLVEIEEAVRNEIPMGYHVHDDAEYHIVDQFPWDTCNEKWARVKDQLELDDPEWFNGFDSDDYFNQLCRRVEYDPMRAINSLGTLGGGNHFIELDEDKNGDYWFVLHSGSRGIGLAIAQYWQEQATDLRTNGWIQSNLDDDLVEYVVPDLDDDELSQWFQGGKGQSYIDSEAIREDVDDNYMIGEVHDQIRTAHPQNRDVNEDLDYLEGQEAAGYLVDMIFAQTYAWESRKEMIRRITETLDVGVDKEIHSPHNMIDFREPYNGDTVACEPVIRKGATRAHDGEPFVLPMNMSDGTMICEGTGNSEWNHTAPHGSGRVMSRTRAFKEIDVDEFKQSMDGIYSTSVTENTLDESKFAYKSEQLIRSAIKPTATIVHNLDPVINWKESE